jgi:hypothetical protein
MPYYYPLKRLNKVERLRTIGHLLKLRDQLSWDIPQKTGAEIRKYYLSMWRTFQVSDHLSLWVGLLGIGGRMRGISFWQKVGL